MKFLNVFLALLIVGNTTLYGLERAAESSVPIQFSPEAQTLGIAEIRVMILRNLIEENSFEKTQKNIFSFAKVDRRFNDTINRPSELKWLIMTLANTFGKHPFSIVKGLQEMNGMRSKEVQGWMQEAKNLELILFLAVRHRDVAEVKKILLKSDKNIFFNINAKNKAGETAFVNILDQLTYQIFTPFDRESALSIIKSLLAAGADVNVQMQTFPEDTAIILATMWGNIEMMREILKHNPDLLKTNELGRTAFFFAATNPNPEFMNILLDYVRKNRIQLTSEIQQTVNDFEQQHPTAVAIEHQ